MPLELPLSAQLGDKAAHNRVQPPCAKYRVVQARQRPGRAAGGPLELVGDTAMLFEEYLLQGE